MAIAQYMHDHGHTPQNAPHTGTPGIWRKLQTLYDLDAIDEGVCRGYFLSVMIRAYAM